MKHWHLLFVLGISCTISHSVTAAEPQTYYTWTDADGIIQITTTPPPSNTNAQLHNVIEYQSPTQEQLAYEQQQQAQRLQSLRENALSSTQSSPVYKTRRRSFYNSYSNPLLEIEKAQCRSMFSDQSDVKQCIQRIYSTRSIRSNINRWYW